MPSTTLRTKGTLPSPRLAVPMSERQQMALLMQMTSNDQLSFEGALAAGTSGVDLKTPPGPSPRRRRNERGETPLHVAAIKGDEDQVRRLITERGADPNAKDFAGWTPLHEACNKGWYGVANALLEAGASVNARGYDDITPLHDAAVNGHAKLVRLLVASGADVSQRNRRGKTPGDEAAPGLDARLFRDAVYDYESENAANGEERRRAIDPGSPPESSDRPASADLCAMRRTPQQHKGEGKSAPPRVTLRLHPIKPRDEKRRVVAYFTDTMETKPRPEEQAPPPEAKVAKEEPTAAATGEDKTSTEKAAENVTKPGPAAEDPAPETSTAGAKRALSDQSPALGPKRSSADQSPASAKKPDAPGSAKKAAPEQGGAGAKRALTEQSLASAKRAAVDQSPANAKRSLTEANEGVEEADDETKKKKRRDSDAGKDGVRNATPGRLATGTGKTVASTEKSSKPVASMKPVASTKPVAVAAPPSKVPSPGDRKSPVSVQSPKPTAGKTADAEDDNEEVPLAKVAGEGGPKVPPLKIVIPQQSAPSEQEQGARNGKNGKALPYVVASSNSNDSMSDKDAGSANPSPTECGTGSKIGDDKKDPLLGNLTAEERSSHQRVLRSSNRSGGSSSSSSSSTGQPSGSAANAANNAGSNASSPQPGSSNNSVGDRNSNNSSPHQSVSQRQSPSPDIVLPPVTESQPVAAVAKTMCISPPVVEVKTEPVEPPPQPLPPTTQPPSVELHPRKRKLKQSKELAQSTASTSTVEPPDAVSEKPEIHPHEQPITNCYQLFLDIRKQIERRRKGLFPVQPKPPSGFKDYLMNRCTYVLAGNSSSRLSIPQVAPPQSLQGSMKDLFSEQEKERYRLRMQHVIEKEKLVLSVEQEILRVHGRAARALANQSLPFSVCTILKDEEVYNVITPEQEEKDRNARSRYNGRLFISWLQDVDDKWEKIKESMLLRHHNEAESLHAVQKMDWEWKMKELGICEFKAKPVIEDLHVPMVHVSDDFDLLPG